MAPPKKAAAGEVELDCFRRGDVEYRVGDCVHVKAEDSDKPYIGVIRRVFSRRGVDHVECAWFYRADEVAGGRKAFHGADEVLRSEHVDALDAGAVDEKVDVLLLEDYEAAARSGRPPPRPTYYSRFQYDPAARRVTPAKVDVVCACELPYNPDLGMARCGGCARWFHPACVGERRGAAELRAARARWVCPPCAEKSAGGASTGAGRDDGDEGGSEGGDE